MRNHCKNNRKTSNLKTGKVEFFVQKLKFSSVSHIVLATKQRTMEFQKILHVHGNYNWTSPVTNSY